MSFLAGHALEIVLHANEQVIVRLEQHVVIGGQHALPRGSHNAMETVQLHRPGRRLVHKFVHVCARGGLVET